MEEVFLIGKHNDRLKIFFVHKTKELKTVWHLGEKYREIAKSSNLRLDRVQAERVEGETEQERKARNPDVHIIVDGAKVMKITDTRFFSEDDSILLTNKGSELFMLGKSRCDNLQIILLTKNGEYSTLWKMTNRGFEVVKRGEKISFSRLQSISTEDLAKLSDDERRRIQCLGPKVRVEQDSEVILELLSTRFFTESSPMKINF
ncbi:MAG: hypothetical protein PHW52_01680 [Candidatus Pacebacteria bacterium]|nr:hypothetical protein [Candidatus Paceibacterota bacterium]